MKIVLKQAKENHNISEKSEIKGAMKLLGAFLGIIVFLYLLFIILANFLVYFISLEKEIEIFGDFDTFEVNKEITKKLRKKYPLIEYKLNVIDLDEENAFAGLGGNIYLTQTLLDSIENENEFLFLIGHEIGHIENRDVFKMMVSKVPVQILLYIVGFGGNEGGYFFDSITLIYSKNMEAKADISGIEYVNNKVGHVGCIMDFFERNNSLFSNITEIVSDHPTTKSRINKLNEYIETKGFKTLECKKFIY